MIHFHNIHNKYFFINHILIQKYMINDFCAEGNGETCPKGFALDTASYCAGMYFKQF